MDGLGRGHAERPEEPIVFHRANVVVAEVIRSIEENAEKQLRSLRSVAKELGQLAEECGELRSHVTPVEVMSGPRAARELRVFESIASAMATLQRRLISVLEWAEPTFRSTLGGKYDPTISFVHEFTDWSAAYRDALADKANAFGERFSRDLRKEADRQHEIASDWSDVDADGLK